MLKMVKSSLKTGKGNSCYIWIINSGKNQKRNEPILIQDCKASYSEAAMGVKNGEIFTENRER